MAAVEEGELLAYQVSEGGDEESILRVIDVATGEVVDGPIDRCRYSPIGWLPGGQAFYYVRRLPPSEVPAGEEQFHRRVWLHQVGADPATDVCVFGAEFDKTTFFSASVSIDGHWLVVSASPGTAPRNDVWIADLTTSDLEAPDLREVQVGVDAQTSVHIGRDGRAYIYTDRDAPRGRLVVASPGNATPDTWRELLPEDPQAVLEDFAILDGDELARPVLLASWTRHAVSELTIHDLATGERLGDVPLPGLGSVGGLSEKPQGGPECWFGYTDHTTPSSVFRYDARSGHTAPWASAPGTVEVPKVHTRQVTYTSRDGTQVRMIIVSPHADQDQPRPTILGGYGGFGASMTPGYSATMLAWIEAGGVYAVANLRGGGEEGESWHRAGMRGHKQNVFDDFHAAADWLVEQGWTTPGQLAISGGSNGGLLVGAALTQAPEKYAAVACSARCSTWCATRGSASASCGARSTAAPPTARNLAGWSPIRPITTWPTTWRTRQCFSPFSTPTPGSIRSMPARCARRCKRRRPANGRSCCGARAMWGTAHVRSAAPSICRPTRWPFSRRTPACGSCRREADHRA